MATKEMLEEAGEIKKKMKQRIKDVSDKKSEYKTQIKNTRNKITEKKSEAAEHERESGRKNMSAPHRMLKLKEANKMRGEASQLQKELHEKETEFSKFKIESDLEIKQMQKAIRNLKA